MSRRAELPSRRRRRLTVLALGWLLAVPAVQAEEPAAEPPLPEKITLPPAPEEAPTVSIRSVDNGDTVEEYRQNGRLTMVKVTPKRGPSYTLLDSNGDGRLDRKDSEGPVAPIYWTLYEWN